mmetsp:Transcript_26539/g.63667  ORF Transcript_26539/g.63667 Transcript_26539/m.63667 type:complete len:266 (+) Transcript_26539:2887-3684(+)
MQYIVGPTWHFEYLYAFRFVLCNLILGRIRRKDFGHVPYPSNLGISQSLQRLLSHAILARHDRGGRRAAVVVAAMAVVASFRRCPHGQPSTPLLPLLFLPIVVIVALDIAIPPSGTALAVLCRARRRSQVIPEAALRGALEVAEFQQRLQHELLAVGHDSKVLQLPVKVGYGLAGEVWRKVLLLVGQWSLPPAKLRRPQQRLAENPPYIPLRIHAVHDEGTPLPLHEEIKVCGELELCQIHPQRGSHVPAEPVHGYDIHARHGDA